MAFIFFVDIFYMNYLDLLPHNIFDFIFDFIFKDYYDDFNQFLTYQYDCDLNVLNKSFKKPSIVYIFTTYTGKDVEYLYHLILLFNLKNKHNISIKKSVKILNKILKKNI